MLPANPRPAWLEARADGRTRVHVLFTRALCERAPEDVVRRVLDGAPDVLQLREKELPASEFLEWAARIATWRDPAVTALVVNDRADFALACGAQGVHLGQDDLPVAMARALARSRGFAIGLSTHDLDQARAAARDPDVDYVGIGPLFPTATKGYDTGIGAQRALAMQRAAERPAFWIGGIDPTNAHTLHGAFGIAVSTAVLRADSPERAIHTLRALVPRTD